MGIRNTVIWVSAIALAGCGGNGNGNGGNNGGSGYTQELEAAGLYEHLGKFEPSMSEEASNGSTTYTFEPTSDGPQCINGSPFRMALRNQDSDDIVVYLQGGGVCYEGLMACTNMATVDGVPALGPLEAEDPENPMADWNHAYVAYCDGSLFVGDKKHDDGRIHHGLQNLSAALDLVKENFTDVNRMLLAGSSAGGFATIWAAGMVRHLYPEVELFVVNDAGVGIARPDDPEFFDMLQEQWGATGLIPDSCQRCMESPHATPLVEWGMKRDDKLTSAAFSSYADNVITNIFLMIPDAQFEMALLNETDRLHSMFPERFKRFFIEGMQHTALPTWSETTKDGTSLREWTGAMVEGGSGWTDMP